MIIVQPTFVDMLKDVDTHIYKVIERAGRTAYKSEDKITDNSSESFIKKIIKLEHEAVLEHGTIYLHVSSEIFNLIFEHESFIFFNWVKEDREKHNYIISASVRSWRNLLRELYSNYSKYAGQIIYSKLNGEYPLLFSDITNYDDIPNIDKYCEIMDPITILDFFPQLYRFSIKFITDRGVSHELVRHRRCSYLQESTRYCNYSKDKFNNQISVIEPLAFKDNNVLLQTWKESVECAEKSYFKLLEQGALPQEARAVLPIDLKTEIIVTTSLKEWEYIFSLRTSPKAHPHIRSLMLQVNKYFHEQYGDLIDD